ncbi:MAG TPA: Gfo/Idh/MocA family oxidoreductase [Anaerolineaceae bacterium]|nr:Gfo/Idh/MocA family oxidoreductase [Anaerolineaceae bacterium]
MAEKIRWGLLSTARINRSVIPGILAARRSELVAVGSRSLDHARKFAREWSIPRVHGSYEELLNDPGVDVIYIPLPNHLHAEWAIKSVKAGKHVLLEKPLAITSDEVQAIRDTAITSQRVVAEAFMYRHHPQTLKVQDLVDSGQVGEVLFINGMFSFTLNRPEDIRWIPENGGGSLWDIGCYPVSYSNMVAGFAPTHMHGFQLFSKSGVDLTFSGHMKYPNGIMAQFYCSFGLPYQTLMEIRGTKGTITVLSPFKPGNPEVPVILRSENHEERFFFPEMELYKGEIEDMESAILDGKSPRLSLEESQQNISTLLALLESAHTGQVVTL